MYVLEESPAGLCKNVISWNTEGFYHRYDVRDMGCPICNHPLDIISSIRRPADNTTQTNITCITGHLYSVVEEWVK